MESRNSQDVLIPGGHIVTAAHCIKWNGDGAKAAFEDRFREPIETRNGKRFLVTTRQE